MGRAIDRPRCQYYVPHGWRNMPARFCSKWPHGWGQTIEALIDEPSVELMDQLAAGVEDLLS